VAVRRRGMRAMRPPNFSADPKMFCLPPQIGYYKYWKGLETPPIFLFGPNIFLFFGMHFVALIAAKDHWNWIFGRR